MEGYFKWYFFVCIGNHMFTSEYCAPYQNIQNFTTKYEAIKPANEQEIRVQDKNFWNKEGGEELNRILNKTASVAKHVAKNVIIFIGDGMGITTTTAARIYKGQRNFVEMGEEHRLSFDNFPNVALVKTYNVDMQVPDSAGTATALFTGVKTRMKAIGLDVNSDVNNFDPTTYEMSKLESIMDWAQKVEKHTGFVTTTRVTHATPAALYAKINNRDWECDSAVPPIDRDKIKDIARQLIENKPGQNFRVILGGGQQQFGYSEYSNDEECTRSDNLNLTQTWMDLHQNQSATFVENSKHLEDIPKNTNFLLGLFARSHMPYELIRNRGPNGTPSLTEMTKKALQVLKQSPKGFVLMVEGGLIDAAHHQNYARLALAETAEFDNAIYAAINETDSDTLILVTSDHSHSFTMNGYPQRGNDILGLANEVLQDSIPYLTLAYANGPGFRYHYQPDNKPPWRDVSTDQDRYQNPWYQHLATFLKDDGTHGGEDVPIYAMGPSSHLVKGVIEQNTVAHIISYAACMGPQAHLNHHCQQPNSSNKLSEVYFIVIILFCVLVYNS